ncbi:hypothetical protein [Nonomuraea sp. CA-141351]|uniref:hypothetical protein n=1 Tax=Nonomuraea sp. CA-141351 TaxID=3239996 RepID=UPI003D9078C0
MMVDNFAALLGVPEGDPLTWILPAVIGVVWALILRAGRPAVYSRVGNGRQSGDPGWGVTR